MTWPLVPPLESPLESANPALAPFAGLIHRPDRDLCTLQLGLINGRLSSCRRCEYFDITAHYITGRGIGYIESATVYPIELF